jgi:hypothetical protein
MSASLRNNLEGRLISPPNLPIHRPDLEHLMPTTFLKDHHRPKTVGAQWARRAMIRGVESPIGRFDRIAKELLDKGKDRS